MKHVFSVRIGPVGFRVGSAWSAPVAQLESLYAGYPKPDVPDFSVRLFPARPWRHLIRPSVTIGGDFMLPDAAPLPLAQGLLAAEMGMNLQMALGQRRFLLLHASAVERDGKALLMTGVSGAGKSTLSALLSARGWRFMGDEFALVDPETGLVHAFPRLISLKNAAIKVVSESLPDARFGPLMANTPKGDIRHLVPGGGSLGGDGCTCGASTVVVSQLRLCQCRAPGAAKRGLCSPDPGVDQLCRARRARLLRADPPGKGCAGTGSRLS